MSAPARVPSDGRKSPHHEAVARFEALQAEAPSLDARPLVRSWERIARIRALGSQPPPLAPEWPGAPEKPYSRDSPFCDSLPPGGNLCHHDPRAPDSRRADWFVSVARIGA